MRIFVISLSDAITRRNSIQTQMNALGIPFEFFNAIDCRQGVPPTYESLIDRNATVKKLGCSMSESEYGVALSHAMIYKKICTENIPHAIILEDDVILQSEFADLIHQNILPKMGVNGMLLYHLFAKGIRPQQRPLIGDYKVCKLAKTPFGAVAYYINTALAKVLYDTALPISCVADWPLDMVQHNVQAVIPRIVQHPTLDMSVLEQHRTRVKKRFGMYGFRAWLKYKILKPVCINISPKIDGP